MFYLLLLSLSAVVVFVAVILVFIVINLFIFNLLKNTNDLESFSIGLSKTSFFFRNKRWHLAALLD